MRPLGSSLQPFGKPAQLLCGLPGTRDASATTMRTPLVVTLLTSLLSSVPACSDDQPPPADNPDARVGDEDPDATPPPPDGEFRRFQRTFGGGPCPDDVDCSGSIDLRHDPRKTHLHSSSNAPGKLPQGFVRERQIRQARLPLQGFSRIQQFVESDGKFSVHWHSFCLKVEPREERATTS